MITYALAPNPKLYFLDQNGKPAAGGRIETYSSIDHQTPKAAYRDPAGLNPWPAGAEGIALDGTGGSEGVVYWEDNGVDKYYIVIRDVNLNLIATVDNYPITGGGGVTPITSLVDIENHMINGQFHFIQGSTHGDYIFPNIAQGLTRLAPGSGFWKDANGEYTAVNDISQPAGWFFNKDGGNDATDEAGIYINTDIGVGLPTAPSANAPRYFKYTLSILGVDPIQDVALGIFFPEAQTFSGETITISFDNKGTVPEASTVQVIQKFGTGGAASADHSTTANFNFNNNVWGRQTVVINVPSVTGKTLGTNHDDSVVIQINMPLSTLGAYSIANLQTQIGTFASPDFIYQTYAQTQYKVLIDIINNNSLLSIHVPVGTIRFTMQTTSTQPGWIYVSDDNQTIGSGASPAIFSGSVMQDLYTIIYVTYDDTKAPVSGGRTAPGNTVAAAQADFALNKAMRFPEWIGRVFAPAGVPLGGTPHNIGDLLGTESYALTVDNLAYHNHNFPGATNEVQSGTGSTIGTIGGPDINDTSFTGSNTPFSMYQPTAFFGFHVKL